ncbi:hypothetical protein EOD40_01910 [Flavobacterium sufflavum]|uniref:Gliding motility protein GldM n=1 Tax=Flavobacterium sufflavum TaxID=1921138 RepID=A0A3S2UN04_9FLAO|nr:hypothetical protein [Flavobacterium sufflavum]RVT79889.1 hypothetical protein EOD40_01910 [Flavobacterium sufflavum]
MKAKVFLLSIFILSTAATFSQNKTIPKGIISTDAVIKKYHDLDELKTKQKGELLELYVERIKVLVKTLPYIAFATKPGITTADIGIPNDSDNRKVIDTQSESTAAYLESTIEFQKKLLPYSDKDNLIAAILFYENIMKSLHEFEGL